MAFYDVILFIRLNEIILHFILDVIIIINTYRPTCGITYLFLLIFH